MAASKQTCDFEVAVKQPATVVWNAMIVEAHRTLPVLAPDQFASVEYTEGARCEKGSVLLLKFGKDHRDISFAKEKIEEVDHDNFSVKLKLVEGGALGKHFREQSMKVKIMSGADANSCVVRFSMEFQSIGNSKFHETYQKEAMRTVRAVESYLNANPNFGCVSN